MVTKDPKRIARARTLNSKLARRVQGLCDDHQLSQRQCALRAGLDPSYVCKILQGQTEPGIVTLEAIAEVFGLSLSELLEGVTR